MNLQSVFVLVLLGVAFVAALRKGKKTCKCGCCGDCKTCPHQCRYENAAIANWFALAAFF